MKRYVIEGWMNQLSNPFEERYPVLEAPVSEPLPQNTGQPGQPNDQPSVPHQIGQEITANQETPDEPGQEPMPGAGPVKSHPMPEKIPDDVDPDEDQEPMIDFETEKIDYMNLALGQKQDEMMDKLIEMRDIKKLSPGQYKFIEDNIQILSLARDVDFADLQKRIYKQLKSSFEHLVPQEEESNLDIEDEIDNAEQGSTKPEIPDERLEQRPASQEPEMPEQSGQDQALGDQSEELGPQNAWYDPSWNLKSINFMEADIPDPEDSKMGDVSGTEVFSILSSEIDQYPNITNVLTKLPSFYSMKSDLFRKVVAATMNGIQIGSGGTLEDVFVPIGKDGVGIKICTRIYTDFGNVMIGKWNIKFNDPENFLSDSELQKLNDTGSPEEKEVLRKRVVIESVAENFKDRVFMVLIINPEDGTRHEIGFNFAELVRDGWKNGYISVQFKANVGKGDAGVKVDGELIDLQSIDINYVKENPDELDEEGMPVKEQIELLRQENGLIYLTIMGDEFTSFADAAKAGLFHMSKPFDSGPEELVRIQRCVPTLQEILLKRCG